jgi:hypothetical protein
LNALLPAPPLPVLGAVAGSTFRGQVADFYALEFRLLRFISAAAEEHHRRETQYMEQTNHIDKLAGSDTTVNFVLRRVKKAAFAKIVMHRDTLACT